MESPRGSSDRRIKTVVEHSVRSVFDCFKRSFTAQHQESVEVPRGGSERSMKGVLASRAIGDNSVLDSCQEKTKSVASRACWNVVSVASRECGNCQEDVQSVTRPS